MEVKSNSFLLAPAIESYRDYRKFLSDFYHHKKTTRQSFSYRQFAQLAGLKSPNYLQLVMQGNRNLSEEMGEAVGKAMGLKAPERRYFLSLIRQENAKTDDELLKANSEGLVALKQLVAKFMNRDHEAVLSKWYHLVIRELAALNDFEPKAEWICQRMCGLVSIEQAETSLQLLMRTGFLCEKEGRLTPADAVIDTGDTLFSHDSVAKLHTDTLQNWAQIIPKTLPKDQELGVLTLSIPKEKIPLLQKKLRDFQDEILGMVSSDKDCDSVVQIGTYLIPITKHRD